MRKIENLLVLLLILSGCSFHKAEKIPQFGTAMNSSESEQVIGRIKKPVLKSFRSLIRVQQQYQGKKASYRQAVAYQAENHLLMEAFPLNSFFTLSRLTITPKKYFLIDFQNDKKFSGDFSEDLLKDLFGMDFTVTEFANLMLGQLPPEWQAALSSAEYYFKKDSIQINLKAQGIYIEADSDSFNLRKVVVYDTFRDKIRLTINYNLFESFEKLNYPSDLQIHFSDSNLDISVRQQLNSLNKNIPINLFSK